MEGPEERVLAAPGDEAMRDIHLLKRDLLALRHALWPTREALTALQRDDTPQVDEALLPYLRDCSDHAFQLFDMVDVYRETAQGLVDLQLSSLSNRMNEVMKVLTMIATIFIPMTFIAGLYGMNFERASPYNLPELGWRFGYVYALGLMVGSASIMLFVFWRLGWVFGQTGNAWATRTPSRKIVDPHFARWQWFAQTDFPTLVGSEIGCGRRDTSLGEHPKSNRFVFL